MILSGCEDLQLLQAIKAFFVSSHQFTVELRRHIEEEKHHGDVDQVVHGADDVERLQQSVESETTTIGLFV